MTTQQMWESVYKRDKYRCIVPQLTNGAGKCYNRWGDPVRITGGRTNRSDLTLAHIKMAPGGPRVDDERHAVMCCWGHHVFGTMYITSKKGLEQVRDYLRGLYGDDYD